MKGKILKVLVVLMIIASMTMANFLSIGLQIAYAISNLDSQNTSLNSNVSFDVTLSENKNHEMNLNIDEGGNLYINVNVKAGSLNDAKIQIQNANFEIGKVENEFVKSVDEDAKTIELNNIQYGNNVTIIVPITFNKQKTIDENYFNRETTFNLSGNYANGEDKSTVSGDIVARVIWEAEADTELSTEIEKFVEIESGKYLVQQKVEVDTVNNTLPKQEEIVTITNNFAEVPTEIVVLKNGDKLSEDKITKNDQTKTVTITTTNNPTSGKIAWGDGKDVYKVIYILESETQPATVVFNTSVETEFYNQEEKVTKQDSKNGSTQGLTAKGEIVSATAESTKEQYKGYMYYGKDNETKYNQKYSIEVSNTEKEEAISVALQQDLLIKEDETKTGLSGNYPYFKTIAIDKNNMKEILGQNGKITITTGVNSNQIIVDANTETNENGYIMVSCVEDNGAKSSIVNIDTTAPVKEGTLDIFVEKAISGNTGLTKNVLKQVKAVEAGIKLNNKDITTQTQLLDTIEPLAKLTMENNVISTINQENNNVKMYVTLVANSNKYDLYKNPQVVVTLPKEVEDFDFEFNPLYADGLTLTNEPELETNTDGTKKIVFTFSGEQANFGNNAVEGVVLEISGNMTVNKLIPTTNTKIKMTYTNANKSETVYEKETDLKINSKDGILTYTKVTEFNAEEDELETMSDEVATGILDMDEEAKTAKVDMAIINNNANPVTDAVIVGKLDTTYEGTLATAVTVKDVEGVKVYYSTNTDEGTNSENWTENYEGAKSYKIVLPNNELANGQIIEFGYSFNVPENLSYNEEVEASYKFNYSIAGGNNNATSGVKLATETNEDEDEEEENEGDEEIDTENEELNDENDYDIENENNESDENLQAPTRRILVGATNIQQQTITLAEGVTATVTAIKGDGITLENEDEVRNGENVKYAVTVKNNSGEDIEKLELNVNYTNVKFYKYITKQVQYGGVNPDEDTVDANYYELTDDSSITLTYSNIKNGEIRSYAIRDGEIITDGLSKESTYEYIVDKTSGDTVKGTFTAIINEENETSGELDTHSISAGKVALSLLDTANEEYEYEIEYPQVYMLNIKNVSGENIENNDIYIKLDESISINEILDENENEISYEVENGVLKINAGAINANESKKIYIEFIVEEFDDGVKILSFVAKETFGEENYYSNKVIKEVIYVKQNIEVSISSEKNKEFVNPGEEFDITLEIKNPEDTAISFTIDEEFDDIITLTKLIKNGKEVELQGTKSFSESDEIASGKTNTYVFTFKIDEKTYDIADIITSFNINYRKSNSTGRFDSKTSDEIIIYLPSNENLDTDINDKEEFEFEITDETEIEKLEPTDENYEYEKVEHIITGTVWIDKNKDGIINDDEETVKGAKVYLVNAETGETIKTTNTTEYGIYIFNDVENGKYIVAIEYNDSQYRVTGYMQGEGSQEVNSKFIGQKIELNENKNGNVYAVTDIIEIFDTTEEVSNVNAGFVEKEKFDLKLDKYVSKIIVQNSEGTKISSYDKTKLAKVEIHRKNVVNSTVIIEYTINITNEGELEGYVGDLIDYIPNDLTFSSEINKDWYISTDGFLHNATLANTLIEPGKTTSVTLTLTKTMTNNNIGTTINTAEIGKESNDLEIEDIDSTPNNRVEGEDDFGKAEVIISVSTGAETTTIITISIIIVSTLLIIGGIYINMAERRKRQ